MDRENVIKGFRGENMKKKTYKRLINRLNRETEKRQMLDIIAKQQKTRADEESERAERYAKRFREFGKNVETVEPGSGKLVVCEKWSIKPEAYGMYAKYIGPVPEEETEQMKRSLTKSIVDALIKNNLIQFIVHVGDDFWPSGFSTIGAKLYVVPWEQMPHKRTIELARYVENSTELEEGAR